MLGRKKEVQPRSERTYTASSDYQRANKAVPESRPLNKYGMMRKTYLKEHRPILYSELTLTERLFPHCLEIEEAANERLELMMTQLLSQSLPPDKASDPMGWIAHMNTLKAQAEEVILSELIYS